MTIPTKGWRERLVRFDREDAAPAVAWCLESHDLVVSKLVAGRQKDVEFAEALLGGGLVDVVLLEQRARMLNAPRAVIGRRRIAISVHPDQNGVLERGGCREVSVLSSTNFASADAGSTSGATVGSWP